MMEKENIQNKASKISEQIIKVMIRDDKGETVDLKEWILHNPTAKELTDRLSDPMWLASELKEFIREEKTEECKRLAVRIRRRKIQRRIVRLSAVAAMMMLFFGVALLLSKNHSENVKVSIGEEHFPVLILGNGQNLNLRSLADGSVIDGGASIRNIWQDGIEYIAVEGANTEEEETLNELVIPRQCTYQVILSDGTVVHLNADSRLEYPVQFVGDERKVKLQGEAYFEVSKSTKPFLVSVNKVLIKVYGTKFNVNAYHRNHIETVLIEGKVGVSCQEHEKLLLPSQVSRVDMLTGEHSVVDIEVDKYISWVEGYLRYDNDELGKMADDLSRWYGVDFHFRSEDIKAMRITASINKDLPLENVLAMIQSTIHVTFINQERGYMILQTFE